MNDAISVDAAHGHGDAHSHHFSRRSYLIGFLLSAVLTAVPFWLVMTGTLDTQATIAAIVVLALAQILVHTRFFLHVNSRVEGGWTLMAYAFAAIVGLIMIAGSLWIMYHLHANMMPMPGAESGGPA